jgi:MFS family permease
VIFVSSPFFHSFTHLTIGHGAVNRTQHCKTVLLLMIKVIPMTSNGDSSFPFMAVSVVLTGLLANNLIFTVPLPYIPFMMVDFNMARTTDEAGYSSGWIMTMFMIGRLCSAVLWGIASDRYGRKICLIFSMCSACIFSLAFGFSTSFSFAIIIRFLTGFFNGFIGISKTYLCEIVSSKEQETRAFAYFSGVQGLGLIIGPMIGGLLARPALQYPSTVPSDHLFGRYPYLLPSLASAILSLIAVIGITIFVPESLGASRRKEKEKDTEQEERSGIKYHKVELNEEDCYDNDLEDHLEMVELVEIQARDVKIGSTTTSAKNIQEQSLSFSPALSAFLPNDDVLKLIVAYSLIFLFVLLKMNSFLCML